MSEIYKTRDQLLGELEEMRLKLAEMEKCGEAFERARKRYRELVDAAPDALIFVDSSYNIVMVNAQAEKMFGYRSGELIGKNLDVLIPDRFRGHHKTKVDGFFANPRTRTMGSGLRIFGLRSDGAEFRADISLSPVRTDRGLLVTAAVRDITEYVDLQERLAQSEKMAALGRISSNIAHELRNPLTAIGGFARRLLEGLNKEKDEKEYAGFIVSEVMNLEKILKYVLQYARVAVPHLEMHDIGSIIKNVLDAYAESCREHNIKVTSEIMDIPKLMIDPEQAADAIGSFVSNAIDAMPSGGELIVTAALNKEDPQNYVTVQIKDTGAGMPPEIIDKIFEPFFTTKISKRGIGLGLPIAKKIMDEHGGFVAVNSTPGHGSAVTLSFPLRSDKGGSR